MQRRHFLGAGASLTLAGHPLLASAQSSSMFAQRRLLVLMLRGGMDGLCAIPPTGDPGLQALRANLVPAQLLRGNDFFGVHPALPTLAALMAQGQAVAVHATGFGYTGRSHFEGQDIMQSGVAKPYASASGWLGRAMEKSQLGAGVAISIPMPLILRGDSKSETQFPTWMPTPPTATYALIEQLWQGQPELATLGTRLRTGRAEAAMAGAPTPAFDNRKSAAGLAHEAALRMQASDGPMVGLIDFNGFDTHAAQGAAEGVHATRLKQVDDAIRSFRQSMGARWDDCLVLTVTEFGRTAAENGTTGTDHGWGGCILAAGGLVKTAGVVADWPGMQAASLFEGRDLKVTVDAAAVYAQALQTVFGLSTAQVQDGVLNHRPHSLAQTLFRA